MNEVIQRIHSSITGEKEQIELIYEPNVEEEQFLEILLKNREKDFKFKNTSSGPHRDDMCVKINHIDIRKYGSQGQQRTAALSLKLSEIHLVERKIKDDVNRQNYLLESIKNIQTMITCTGLDEFVNSRFEINKLFKVVDGTIVN